MFPFVRIQEGLPVLTPPPMANLFFDVDIISVVTSFKYRMTGPRVMVTVMYKMRNNTPQDLEEYEYGLTFSFVAEGQVVKITDVKKKIKKWASGSWTEPLSSPRVKIELPAGMVLIDNARDKGTIEFIIDGEFVYLVSMQFSKTKNMTGNGGNSFE